MHFKGHSNNEIEGDKNMAEKPLQPIPPKKEERYYTQSLRSNGKNGSLLGIVICVCFWGHNEPAPTSALEGWTDGKWSGNSFLLKSSSIANHGD
jgi:hypothetical protein